MLLILFYKPSVCTTLLSNVHCYFVVFFLGGEGVSRGNRGQLKSFLQMGVWLMLFLFAMDCLLIWVERLNRINLRSTEICWLGQKVQKYYRDQWRIQGGAQGARDTPLFLDQNEARRAEKNVFGGRGPPLSRVLDDRPPSEGLDPPLETNTKILSLRHCLTLILGQGLWRTTIHKNELT